VAITSEDAERILGEAPVDKCFICRDGCLHRTLSDLENCLTHMDQSTFTHHVTSARNDFSNWVRDVMGDDVLADQLAKAKDRKESARAVKNRIAWLLKAKVKDSIPQGHGTRINWVGDTKS
jgi:hypothetical protein